MPTDPDLLLYVASAEMGGGEPDLGEKLISLFLDNLLESGRAPAQCIFVNSGVFLTTEGSVVTDTLRRYEQEGSEIRSCATCLDYYGRTGKLIIGKPSNMKETVHSLRSFKKVIRP